MPNTVLPRARTSKSSRAAKAKNPKCPKCGSVLTVVRDDETLTTLECGRCRKGAVADWLGTEAGYRAVRDAARRQRPLLHRRTSLDDLSQEIVLALLEHPSPAAPERPEFAGWLESLAKAVATGEWRKELEQPGAVDAEILQAVVEDADGSGVEPEFEFAADMKRFLDARRKRVARVLAKLSEPQRAAVRAKFFDGKHLSDVAKGAGKCASADRMNLLRAKRKLAGLMTADGYALAA